jgi:hypothetical protein
MKFSYLFWRSPWRLQHRPVNTIKFPDRAYQYGVYGTVHVQYDVNKDGRIENIVVKDDEDGYFTKQIVNDMKHWRLDAGSRRKPSVLLSLSRDRVRAKGGFLEN